MKHNFVRLRAILAASAFTAGIFFTGCGGRGASGAGAALTADFFTVAPGGEITVSAYDSEYYRFYLEIAAELFEDQYPGVKVNIETFSAMPEIREMDEGDHYAIFSVSQDNAQARADYLSRVNTRIMSGTGADVYAMDIIPLHKFIESGTLENLDPYMNIDPGFNRADYRQNILEALRYRNGLWFLPMDYKFNYFSYDSTLFPPEIAAGFGTDKVWTTEELFNIALPLYAGTHKLFNMLDYNQSDGGMFNQFLNENILSFMNLETKRANFADGRFSGILESVKKYGEDGLIPQGVTGRQDSVLMMQQFEETTDRVFFKLNGNLSLVTQFSRGLGMSMDMSPPGSTPAINRDDDIAGVMALAGGSVPFEYSWGFAINSQSKNKALAWAFLKFLSSEMVMLFPDLSDMCLPIHNAAREQGERSFLGLFAPDQELNNQQRGAVENYIRAVETLSDRINTFVVRDTSVNDMIAAEVLYYFNGSRTAEETARVLQNKVDLYLSE